MSSQQGEKLVRMKRFIEEAFDTEPCDDQLTQCESQSYAKVLSTCVHMSTIMI